MSFYPELDTLNLDRLIALWNNVPSEGYECDNVYYDELSNLILEKGEAGRRYLINALDRESNSAKLGGLLFFLPLPEAPLPRNLLLQYMHESDPHVVSRAIHGLIHQDERDVMNDVLELRIHTSPLVRSSVLRFLSSLYPELAKPFLIEALKDSNHIVRESAIDGLEELETVESIYVIKPLLFDSHPSVRQSAQTAIENLER